MVNVKKTLPKDKSGNMIAVYYACGEIVDNSPNDAFGMNELIVGNKVITDLSKLREDETVKAVVLRVNSPGGSAFASEQIWNEVVKLKAKKPVIVSMGGMAASGGYYISCAADSIYADPTTITGSIGIFGMIPNFHNLLNDKLGLNFEVVKTNTYSDFIDLTRAVTPEEGAMLQKMINRGYELFVKRCADGRGMSVDAIKKVAEGRVWSGITAQELGLVDHLGGLDAAIASAAQKANISEYTLQDYPQEENFINKLLNKSKDEYINAKAQSAMGEYYHGFRFIRGLSEKNRIQTHVGFEPNIQF